MPTDAAPPVTPAQAGDWTFMLRALAYRNYRLFFGGQIVSLVGTWLSMVASQWLVMTLALRDHPHSAEMWMGIVGFAGQIPVFLLTPLAGAWIDRLNRHRLLMFTQFLSMLQSFAMGALILADVITIPHIIALNALQGLINAFDIPARQSFVVDLIEKREDLSNAIALNSSMVHVARLLGPPIAGFLIAIVGEAMCFMIDGVSFFAVLIALGLMRVVQPIHAGPRPPVLHSMAEGFRYAFGFPPVRVMLMMTAVTSLMAMSQSVLMPLFAKEIYKGDATTLGWLLGASGVGAVTGTVYLASRRSVLGLGRVIWIACAAMGSAFVLFSQTPPFWLALPVLMVSGGAMVIQMASCNTVLQTIVEDDKRGRVMSLFTMAFMGMAPFGSLLAGTLAGYWGPPRTLLAAGCICVVAAISFALYLPRLRPLVRPIYQRKGILPEVAAGLLSAAAEATNTPK
jgi:MFS family permease